MPISDDRYEFKDVTIISAPTYKGVYALDIGQEIIYIGKADGANGIRERLQAHKRGDEGPCTLGAIAYMREQHDNPSGREKELLEEYERTYGKFTDQDRREMMNLVSL